MVTVRDVLAGRSQWAIAHGDVLERLAELPDESVDCVVTSPPYWGLRDYGTARWEGGDPECAHKVRANPGAATNGSTLGGGTKSNGHQQEGFKSACRHCGAIRVDRQIGLEATPEDFLERLVRVFREVRRVLKPSGTCWVNLGDSYNSGTSARRRPSKSADHGYWQNGGTMGDERVNVPDLAPKQLVGIPWRVAFALQADGWWLRSDVIWAKPNPMPESVTDRPTRSHEYLFLLTKAARYWYDADAIREPAAESVVARAAYLNGGTKLAANSDRNDGDKGQRTSFADYLDGRNKRTVWTIATEPYPDAHFATYPTALVEPCILAGAPEFVCSACGSPVVKSRHENVPQQSAVQAQLRRVRPAVRGPQSEVLQPIVREQGSGSPAQAEASAVHQLWADVQPPGSGTTLLPEVQRGMADQERTAPDPNLDGRASAELEGRQDPRGWLHQGLRSDDEEIPARTPDGDGDDARSPAGAGRIRPPQERDQVGQPARESGVDGAEPASGHGDVPSLRADLRHPLSPCCSAPLLGGVCLDPFAGSGTTLLVALRHGRRALGIDLNGKYVEMASRRIAGDCPLFNTETHHSAQGTAWSTDTVSATTDAVSWANLGLFDAAGGGS